MGGACRQRVRGSLDWCGLVAAGRGLLMPGQLFESRIITNKLFAVKLAISLSLSTSTNLKINLTNPQCIRIVGIERFVTAQ